MLNNCPTFRLCNFFLGGGGICPHLPHHPRPVRLCLGLSDNEGMHYFIQGLHPDLKGHVILGQPKTLAEGENLAHLKEAVSVCTPNLEQYIIESQLQSVLKSLEALASDKQQNQAPNIAAYSNYLKPGIPGHEVHNSNHGQYRSRHTSPPGSLHDSNNIAKLVREEVRRQTQYLTQTNRPSSSGVPSNRNRRTTDGLPICNKCKKVGHIARNCRAGGIQHQLPQVSQYNFHIHPSMQHQISSQFNSYTRPGMQHQSVQRPQFNSNIHPDAPTFNQQQGRTGEAMILEKFEKSKCLEMFNENVVENLPDKFNDVSDMLINIEEGQHDFDSPPFLFETSVNIHPDLVDIDFSLAVDKSLSALCKENNSSGLPKINCDTLTTNVNPVNQMCTDSFP